MFDLIVRNGFVVDGSGDPGAVGDIAVADGRIVDVGQFIDGQARQEFDAEGLLVTPGFVDIHTHYDAQATWDPWLTPSSWHGVTTVVMGNCGVGFAPAAPDRHNWLIELMEGVEDIPGSAMTEGITWRWESFGEYLAELERSPRVLDVGTQIAHGPLRAYVMGERGASNEPATEADITSMALIVEQALHAGALGFSTSRTPIHRSKSGELVPGTTAHADELLGIGEALRRAGHGVFQYAPEHIALPEREWGWMRELARRTGRTVSVNLNQSDAGPDVWRTVLELLEQANLDGLPIVAQAAGRSIGIIQCLHGSIHPLLFHPAYQEVGHSAFADRLNALRTSERYDRLVNEIPDDGGFFQRAVLDAAGRMFASKGGEIEYEPHPDASLRSIAQSSGTPVMRLIVDQLLADDGRGMIYTPFFNYSYGDLSFSEALHRHPLTRMGLSDAGAHCGAICDGGTPTFMLTHWTRDRVRGPKLDLEHVVHRQTSQTAALYGLTDRGLIRPGKRADLNVIDYDRLNFGPARMAFDFPAGARRLVQQATGYRATFVNGVQTVHNDSFTGELPGRLIRGPHA